MEQNEWLIEIDSEVLGMQIPLLVPRLEELLELDARFDKMTLSRYAKFVGMYSLQPAQTLMRAFPNETLEKLIEEAYARVLATNPDLRPRLKVIDGGLV